MGRSLIEQGSTSLPRGLRRALLCASLVPAVLLIAGCGGSDSKTADAVQANAVSATPGLSPSNHGQPFSATGTLALVGTPPFAFPVLETASGQRYRLAGPERAKCVQMLGQRVQIAGKNSVGNDGRPLVDVVQVTEVR